MRTEEKVFFCIEKYQMIPEGSHVIMGLSGGADSVCLLKLLKEYKKQQKFQLYAVHVNHHIRGEEAVRDEEFSKAVCQKLEFCLRFFITMCLSLREEKLSLEEAGRNVQREAFERVKRASRCRERKSLLWRITKMTMQKQCCTIL